jgi:hypothetical protein
MSFSCISSHNTFCPAFQLWPTLYQVLSIQIIHFSLLIVLEFGPPFIPIFMHSLV